MLPIPVLLALAAGAMLLASRRRQASGFAAGQRFDYWDRARWARDRMLHLEERRRLIWNPDRNAWYRAEELGYAQPVPAQTWVPATQLKYGALYRFAGVRPPGMSTTDLRAALSNLGWRIRSFWRSNSPSLPPDYPGAGRPAAMDDPQNGYVVEAYWYAPTAEMQQGIEAPMRYHGAAVAGFMPGYGMGYVPPPPPGRRGYRPPPRGGYRPPPPRAFRPPPPRAFRPPPRHHWRRPWGGSDYVPPVPEYVPQPQYIPQPEYVPVPQQQPVYVPVPQQVYVPVPTDGAAPQGGAAEELPPDQGAYQGAPDQGAPDQDDQGQGQPPPNGGDGGGATVSGWGQGYGPWQHGGAAWGYGNGAWGWPWDGYPPYAYGYPYGYNPYAHFGYATGLNLLNLAKDVALAPLELAEAPFKASAHVAEHVAHDVFGGGGGGAPGPGYGYGYGGVRQDDRWRRDQWHREHERRGFAPPPPHPAPPRW